MAKRGFDLLLAILGLILFSPLFLMAWVMIKSDDRGPALFRQHRVGKDGVAFVIFKFRSMRSESMSAGREITAAGDSRITKAGRWLRSSKVDELPQLWNVIRGEMSLVGPRPEVPRYVASYSEAQRAVLRLRPGITDEASIEFCEEEKLLTAAANPEQFYLDYCMPRKIAINLAYAERANVVRDVGVILRTIAAVWVMRSPR